MHVFKIAAISVFLLLAAVPADAQTDDASEHINPIPADSAAARPEVFEINGTKVVDSTVAFGADTVLKADTTAAKGKKHTAKKAVLYSAALPGLGQIYNKKYWKLPIIYAGFGGLGYALYYTSHNFNLARAAYRTVVRQGDGTASYLGYSDATDLKYFRDQFKNYLNLSALVTVLWYGLNLIDAAVDGHLYNYNMDDKLTFNLDPSFLLPNPLGMSQTCLGMTFTIRPGSGRHKAELKSF